MKLTKEQEQIMKGKICPYCKAKSEFIDSSYVYGESYGMIYICKPCNAYCGVHKGTKKSLGRLANKDLRNLKKEAHVHFDRLWASKNISRSKAYEMLSEYLKLPIKYTHIGMFNNQTCFKTIEWAKRVTNKRHQSNILDAIEYSEYLSLSEKRRTSYFRNNIFSIIGDKVREIKQESCYTDLAGKVKFYPKSNKILFCKECRWEEDGLDHFIQHLSF